MNSKINKANAEFWNELCGSSFAQYLGIKDHSLESLKRFDEGYLNYYPYLFNHIPLEKMKGKRVLEVGLGYGTVGQRIALAGARYIGLDVALGPVRMMNHRLRMHGLNAGAVRGSMLECPIASGTLDYVVSIGCFHHTGDVNRCIQETYRILRMGGMAIIMVYNQFSFRQWRNWPWKTLLDALKDCDLYKANVTVSEAQRKAYDTDTLGRSAVETIFVSIKQLRKIFAKFSFVEFYKENCTDIHFGKIIIKRDKLLRSLGGILGLDIYIRTIK